MYLEVSNLSYRHDNRVIFDGVCLSMDSGEVLWVKGGNGHGKTTLLRVLAGFYSNFKGNIRIAGNQYSHFEYQGIPKMVYIGHENGVHPNLTVIDNLKSLVGLSLGLGWFNDERIIEHALNEVGLNGFEDRFAHTLSAGQRRRIGLAQLVLSTNKDADQPVVWVLDEPFNALDEKGISWLRRMLSLHVDCGGLVIFTSHQSVIEQLPVTVLELANFKPSTSQFLVNEFEG